MTPHLFIEPGFSIEHRIVAGREFARSEFELAPVPDFLVLHFLKSQNPDYITGTSLFINPNQTARLSLNQKQNEFLLVRIAPALLIETATRLRLNRRGANLLFRLPLTSVSGDRKLRGVLEAIAGEMESSAAGWREVIRSHINQLSVYLLRAHINVQPSDEIELSRVGVVDRRLRRAIEFMHDNCGRELSLSEIAAAAYLSEFHFARLFKKITGSTPHGFLAGLRIERARRLLAESDLPINEVGAQVGYGSQSHFTKIFREATGMTPNAFRHAARSTGSAEP